MKTPQFLRSMSHNIFFILITMTLLLAVPALAAYTPPTGIPLPSFGIDQLHTSYSGRTYTAGGFAYRDAGNGPYSHYVDNTSSNCTDISNAYGTVTTPRCSLPATYPAGSVVELHGGPYSHIYLSDAMGTSDNPIYIRGANESNKASFIGDGTSIRFTIEILNSAYVILENIITDGGNLTGAVSSGSGIIRSPADHIAIRHSEVKNYPIPDLCGDANCWNISLWSTGAGTDGASGNTTSNIVFYDNYIHNNAAKTWPPPYETGRHGIMVEGGAEYVWILNNRIDHSGDDGVQIWWKATGANGPPAHHVYIGNNTVHDMGENAFDIKQAYDVVISQNKVWGFHQTAQLGAGSDGSAIVLNNDDPSDRLWVLYNEIFNSNIGIRSQAHGSVYIIGNIIHDIVRVAGAVIPSSSTGSSSGCAIITSSSPNLNIVNNTIDQIDGGIFIIAGPGAIYNVSNNIISNMNETIGNMIAYNVSTPMLNANNNLLYSANGTVSLKKVTCTNCITANPLYENQAERNYSLKTTSPAIGHGLLTSIYPLFFNTYNLPLKYNSLGVTQPFSYSTLVNQPIDIGACHNLPTEMETPNLQSVKVIP